MSILGPGTAVTSFRPAGIVPLRDHSLRRRSLPLVAPALAALLALSACGENGPDADTDDAAETEEAAAEDGGDRDESAEGGDDGEDQESSSQGQDGEGDDAAFAVAELADAAGNTLGSVEFREVEGGVEVATDLTDLDSGFRGIAVHEVGECEPQSSDDSGAVGDFLSAGGHLEGDAEEDSGVVEGEDELEQDPDVPDRPEGELPGAEPEDGEATGTHPGHAGDLPNLLITEDGIGQLTTVTDRLTSDLLLDGDGSAIIVYAGPDNHANIPDRYTGFGADEETLATGDAGDRSACGVVEPA